MCVPSCCCCIKLPATSIHHINELKVGCESQTTQVLLRLSLPMIICLECMPICLIHHTILASCTLNSKQVTTKNIPCLCPGGQQLHAQARHQLPSKQLSSNSATRPVWSGQAAQRWSPCHPMRMSDQAEPAVNGELCCDTLLQQI